MIPFIYNSLSELETKLIDFKVLFAYHSNKIENDMINYHDTREIFENGRVISYTGDLRVLYEISNQVDCYHFLKDKIINKEKLSIELIKQIHFQLAKHMMNIDIISIMKDLESLKNMIILQVFMRWEQVLKM